MLHLQPPQPLNNDWNGVFVLVSFSVEVVQPVPPVPVAVADNVATVDNVVIS